MARTKTVPVKNASASRLPGAVGKKEPRIQAKPAASAAASSAASTSSSSSPASSSSALSVAPIKTKVTRAPRRPRVRQSTCKRLQNLQVKDGALLAALERNPDGLVLTNVDHNMRYPFDKKKLQQYEIELDDGTGQGTWYPISTSISEPMKQNLEALKEMEIPHGQFIVSLPPGATGSFPVFDDHGVATHFQRYPTGLLIEQVVEEDEPQQGEEQGQEQEQSADVAMGEEEQQVQIEGY